MADPWLIPADIDADTAELLALLDDDNPETAAMLALLDEPVVSCPTCGGPL